MPSVEVQAAALAGMLAAATGSEPTTTTSRHGLRIEAVLPDRITPTTRSAILTALAIADEYGHNRTAGTETVWAVISAGGQS